MTTVEGRRNSEISDSKPKINTSRISNYMHRSKIINGVPVLSPTLAGESPSLNLQIAQKPLHITPNRIKSAVLNSSLNIRQSFVKKDYFRKNVKIC